MNSSPFNLANFLVSMVAGWFVLAFLHSGVVSLFTGAWSALMPRFKDIAFFRDGRAAAIDVAIVLVFFVGGNIAWHLARVR
ncbi:MAG TPA: hypothetical protein PKW82_02505 [Spirochaetales bacterium]|nr:hypothetical protein [Spirochaetales bacterium]